MGLLNIFRRREKTFIEKWRKETRGMYTGEGNHDQSIPEKLLVEFFSEAGKNLRDCSVHINYSRPYKKISDPPAELRGFYRDFPVRISYNEAEYDDTYVIYNGNIRADIKIKMQTEMTRIIMNAGRFPDGIFLWRNHDKIPVKSDPGDPWHSEDISRIFLAKGIYVEGFGEKAEMCLGFFNMFSEGLRSAILEAAESIPVESLEFYQDRVSLTVGLDVFHSMKDPVIFIQAAFGLLFRIAGEITLLEATAGEGTSGFGPAQDKKIPLMTCGYCTTRFAMTANASCPNCGAPVP